MPNSNNKEIMNTFEWMLFFSLLIFLAEYPDKPKCIKYFCSKMPHIKWLFIFGWLYGRKNNYYIFCIIFIVYHILYLYDDYLYNTNENFKQFKDDIQKK